MVIDPELYLQNSPQDTDFIGGRPQSQVCHSETKLKFSVVLIPGIGTTEGELPIDLIAALQESNPIEVAVPLLG
jgi:hypothetical protein